MATLESMEMRIYSEGGKTKEERLEKYKMVSSHCARRSFAFNFYDMGIPAFIIMQITAHSTEKQFFEYIDLSQKDLAKKFFPPLEKFPIQTLFFASYEILNKPLLSSAFLFSSNS